MTLSNSEISLCVDTMIVEALLTDSHLSKFAAAGFSISELLGKVKEYFGNHFDSNDKVGSVVNMLAPGALSLGLKAMGFGWLGPLLALAMSVFHIDVNAILTEVWNGVKGAISSGKQTSSEQVDKIVDSAVASNVKPATEEEAAGAQKMMESRSYALREAKLLKVAMIEFDRAPETFTKEAGLFDWFSGKKSTTASLLGTILKWIFKVVLASAGFMVAGDVINKFLDRPNALDGSLQQGKPVSQAPSVPAVTTTQTRFPVNPAYRQESHPNGWVENVHNDPGSIANMLVGWAKQVYQGLDGLDSVIQSGPDFQGLVDLIAWQNHTSEGGPIVFIPQTFTSKKMVVDHFIDEVAEKAPK